MRHGLHRPSLTSPCTYATPCSPAMTAPWGSPPAPLTSQPAAFTLGLAWELTGAASGKAGLAQGGDVGGRGSLWEHPFPSSFWPRVQNSRISSPQVALNCTLGSPFSSLTPRTPRTGRRDFSLPNILPPRAHLPLPAVHEGGGLTLREPAQPLACPGFPPVPSLPT